MVVERQSSPRILRGTGDFLEVTLYSDGTPTDADANPTVVITRGDGTTLASGTSTKPADTTGVYRFSLTPAQTATVEDLEAVWTFAFSAVTQSVTTYGRIVGDLLFTEAEARAFDPVESGGIGALQNPAHYPDRLILQARDRIQDQFEDYIEMPLGLRWFRRILAGEGDPFFRVPDAPVETVRAVAIRESGSTAYTALTSTELESVYITLRNRIFRENWYWPIGINNVRIDYEAGLQPIPEDLKYAALWKLRYDLVPSDLPRTALSQTTELGTFRLSAAGERGAATGIPIVDEILARYKAKALVVA